MHLGTSVVASLEMNGMSTTTMENLDRTCDRRLLGNFIINSLEFNSSWAVHFPMALLSAVETFPSSELEAHT